MILQAEDIPEEVVDVPEWGVKLLLRGMDGRQRARFGANLDQDHMYADLLIPNVFDPETRQPVFDPADREALQAKNGVILERLARVILGYSGVNIPALVEEVEENPTSGGSSS
jgi:hypothetical protein